MSLGHWLPWLQLDLEAFSTFQDDVSLQSEVALFDGRLDSEVPQDRREEDFQLQHCVFTSYAGSGSSRERNEGVVMTICCLLRKEVVWVEDIWIGIDVGLSVQLQSCYDDSASCWDRVVSRC